MTDAASIAPATLDAAATLERILDERYSCRGFTSEPVPEETIEQILRMAQRTASWCNSQAWQVDLVTGDATAAFSTHLTEHVLANDMRSDFPAPERYDGVYGDRRRASGYGLYTALGIERSDQEARLRQMLENYRFFGAPHVAIITSDAGLGTYGAVDCGGYVSTFLAAATSLGVATCAQAAIALYSDAVREHLSIPADRLIVCGIAFGYADENHPANTFRAERADLGDVVRRHG
ncbi:MULTISPECIES: nitroreductase [Dietzia]|uniref:Nitroreductase n=1 Tax=Dietzia cinnamea TaxID=321318 RepID=A0AAW5Q5N4_9ACTN|nr:MULTISPECIES: nitroreductase [Dietzia]KZO58031.1 nitroreductase [Dietzia maris]MBM7231236.1 nitroreductase [Dietzia cinnamea]MCT1641117.1 nitroreductase [Dietzia cinnamea]MCT1865086.1 nitroreductase [Dietzia cinnamea]MCT1883940.1 nitroreductase [Dietzia cinnamea]